MDERQWALVISLLSAPVAVGLVKLLEVLARRYGSGPPRRTPMEDAVLLIQELQEEVTRLRAQVVELERRLTDALTHVARLECERPHHSGGPRPTQTAEGQE